jgi:RHS repeat-associated protein
MLALAQTTGRNYYTPAANDDCIKGGSRTRTKYTYDAAGNTLTYATVTATYNNRGRMATLKKGTVTETLVYNALGQMVKTSGGALGTELLMYDEAGHVIGEYSSSGALIQETIWLGDIPVATLRPKTGGVDIFYVHTDHLNTPRRVSRPSDNKLRWTWLSDPFGTTATNENPAAVGTFKYNLRFPGQIADSQAGLSQNMYRDLDPATGRYIESDPLGFIAGHGTYSYVGSNPTNFIDPFGLDAIDIRYDYYPVNTGLGFHLPLGHGAVIAVDPITGSTRYYEFGRYADKKCGNVIRRAIPDVKIGPNGRPQQKSLDALYEFVSKNYGEGSHVSATYYQETNYKAAVAYAERFSREHECYSLIENNCKTFAHDAATAK